MHNSNIFHLAIPVNDLELAKKFYCFGLDCTIGRETAEAMILNFYGHQVVTHMTQEPLVRQKGVYPRHFGLIFDRESVWEEVLHRAKKQELLFYIEPKLRFIDRLSEHRTFFLEDPFYNLLEFKFYRHSQAIFGTEEAAKIGDR